MLKLHAVARAALVLPSVVRLLEHQAVVWLAPVMGVCRSFVGTSSSGGVDRWTDGQVGGGWYSTQQCPGGPGSLAVTPGPGAGHLTSSLTYCC